MKNQVKNVYVLLCTVLSLLLSTTAHSQQTLTQINGWNAYVHLPASYSSTSIVYPTIIFFPGIGEIGTNAGALISNGPGAYLSQGWNGNVLVDGSTIEFIIISIQPPNGYPNELLINEKIQTIKSLYRVNPNKLYLTGLSHGGWCSTTYVTGDPLGGPYSYASQIAAVVEVQGVVPDDNAPYPNLFDNYANAGGKLLGLEQAYDNRGMPTRVNRMNATKPGSAIYVQTNFGNGGHCCWNQFYGGQGVQPGIFLLNGVNQNLYQWLARQSIGVAVNQAPVANAGADKIVTLPGSSTTLDGSGSDPDGSIASWLWTKISGPAAGTISNTTSAQANVSALAQGVYQYQLKVTDNSGANSTDLMQITVNAAANIAPTVDAGSDQTITLPTNTATLNAIASDADGTIVSYQWSKTSGPSWGTISNASNASTNVTGLLPGIYTYQIIATDNAGATATDNIIITVNAANVTTGGAGCNSNTAVTYNISQTSPGEIYRPNGSAWKGGDTIKITGTNYSVIEFYNIAGDPCRPLVIMPMTTLSTPIFRIKGDCRYLKIWGGNTPYGIKIVNGTLAIASSHHIEVNNVEAYGGNTGVYCKQNVDYADPLTWHPTYRMSKLIFKNMWVHDVDGEGMYIGITQPDGVPVRSTYSGLDTIIIPVRLDSVEISNCIVERATWDAIQLSNARNGNKIFNNTIKNYGTLNINSQQAGIILGGNTTGGIYGNTITNGTGNGIQAFGYGVINIYNNIMDSCGYDGRINTTNGTEGQQSIYASDYVTTVETNPKQTINIYGNTIKHPKTAGAVFITGYSNNSFPSAVYNNIFCIPNAPVNWQSVYIKTYVAGSTNSNNTISCAGGSNALPVANAGSNIIITLPVNSTSISGSGTDADGTIAAYNWSFITGPAGSTITGSNQAVVNVSNLVQGLYNYELTVTDNVGAIAKDTVSVTVNASGITLLPAVNPANTVNGLEYKYYEGSWSVLPPFSSLTPVKTGTAATFDLSLANRPTQYGFSFSGFVNVPADGVYTFYTTSDDGSNLYIDNVLTVMNDGLHGAIEKSGTIGLKAGKHAIEGLYFEQAGQHIFNISYEGMGITKQTIPTTALFRIVLSNTLPTANAGSNIIITLPVNSTSISGSGTDADGTIAAYNWSFITGPAGSTITGSNQAVVNVSNLVQGLYNYELTVTDNVGAIAKDTVSVTVNASGITLLPAVNPANTVNGVEYKYYEGSWSVLPPFSSLTPVKTGTAATFDITLANRSDQYGFSFTGFINVPADGVYTFYTTSDDGSNLYIDNVLTVMNDGLHGAIEKSGTIGLKVGKHAIEGLFFEQAGGHVFNVSYEGMGITKQTIPTTALYRIATANNTNKIVRVNIFGGRDPFSDTKWNNWNVSTGLNSSNFLYEDKTASGMYAEITGDKKVVDNGVNYAGGATICPAPVLRYNTAATSQRTLTLRGLNPAKKYTLEFYASRASIGNKTLFVTGNKTDTINTDNNINDHARFYDIVSDNTGKVSIIISTIGTWNYLAGFSIIEQADMALRNATVVLSEPITAAPIKQIYPGQTIVELGANAVSVYPNPFVGSFKVALNNKLVGEYILKLSAASGQTVIYRKINKTTATAIETINVNNLTAGNYFLQVISVATGNKTIHKVIKN